MTLDQQALDLHRRYKGKFSTQSKIPIKDSSDLSLVYSPGVAAACKEIVKDAENMYVYTSKSNTVAVVSDGSAVLGLGNIGPQAALPVMEGKAALFKVFADVDAVPICVSTQDVDEIVETVERIASSFGGINLEDIKAPECFEVERRLKESLDIPVFHDDQHGTAIVVLAGLINACKVVGKELSSLRVVINGSGAAGVAISKLLLAAGVSDIVVLDSKGVIVSSREDLNNSKSELATITNPRGLFGSLSEVIEGADVFIGVSVANILSQEDVSEMADDAVVFALANPDPEILPADAYAGGARIVSTGRSDFANQVNNVLVFPGIFRGLLDSRIKTVTDEIMLSAASAIASCISSPSEQMIVPKSMDKSVAKAVSQAVSAFA